MGAGLNAPGDSRPARRPGSSVTAPVKLVRVMVTVELSFAPCVHGERRRIERKRVVRSGSDGEW